MNQLNLPEFRVLKVEENEQKDLKFTVEAIKPIVSCPECGNEDCYKHAPMERFVRDLNMFNLRAKILFSTKATIRPKYDKDNGYMRIGNMLYNTFDFDYSEPRLKEGFGVLIPQLLEVIERDDF